MQHPLQCRCETIKGFVQDPRTVNHALCYCRDCQAFAHFLGQENAVLDAIGGTEVVQVPPSSITITRGSASLACMRLTEKGLLRWYADCCKTPIGNTLANYQFSFIGIVHNCLENAQVPIRDSFGPIGTYVNTNGAHVTPKPKSAGVGSGVYRILAIAARARLNGDYQRNPFFSADGIPIAVPRILGREELGSLMQAVSRASIVRS
jgi:hypothetical protein